MPLEDQRAEGSLEVADELAAKADSEMKVIASSIKFVKVYRGYNI